MWQLELYIKGIQKNKENTKVITDTIQEMIDEIGAESEIVLKDTEEYIRIHLHIPDINPTEMLQYTDKIGDSVQENIDDFRYLFRVFTIRKQEQRYIEETEPSETPTEVITETGAEYKENRIWAEVHEGTQRVSRQQPMGAQRYTRIFTYNTVSYRVTIDLPVDEVAEARKRPRDNWKQMMKHAVVETTPIAQAFENIRVENNWTKEELANFILTFAQYIPYVKDKVSVGMIDYHSYPSETLYQGIGDCEDKSILYASILKNLNYDVVLLNPPAHIAVGVAGDFRGYAIDFKGETYYYAETTTPGWHIGEIMADLIGKDMDVIRI